MVGHCVKMAGIKKGALYPLYCALAYFLLDALGVFKRPIQLVATLGIGWVFSAVIRFKRINTYPKAFCHVFLCQLCYLVIHLSTPLAARVGVANA